MRSRGLRNGVRLQKAIVADGQDETLVQRRLVGGTAESFQHSEAVLRKVVALDGLDISPTLLVGGFLAGLFQSRNFVKAERQGARVKHLEKTGTGAPVNSRGRKRRPQSD